MKNSTKSALLMALLFVAACKRESVKPQLSPDASMAKFTSPPPPPPPNPGSAVFNRFISIGDSQTAGYANDGLYNTGMNNSFPDIMASKFAAVGLASFNQPLFSSDQQNGTGFLEVSGFTPDGLPTLKREVTSLGVRGSINVPGFGVVPLLAKYAGDNDNYGIVGLRVADINNPLLGNVNSYFERLLPGNSPNNTTTYVDFITAKSFDFFSLNLGSNDVLGYVLTGGADVAALTSPQTFTTNYTQLVDKLTQNGAKGVLTNIPDIFSTPFLNVIKVTDIVAKAQMVNPAFTKLYIMARKSSQDAYTTYNQRVATADDKLLLTFDASKVGTPVSTTHGVQPYGLSAYAPIESKWVFDSNEVLLATRYLNAYNTTISSVAATKSLALFNAHTFFKSVTAGLSTQGLVLSSAYLTGGVFSLDGLHLTPRGNALVANCCIAAINTTYGSTIKRPLFASYSAN